MGGSFQSFQEGDHLELPHLAEAGGLDSADFVVEELIAGGMGVCVKVKHQRSGAHYALKTVRSEFLQSDEHFKRFTEEAKIWITLSTNGGIVQALTIERVNEIPVVCARWMHEGSLRGLLSIRKPRFLYESIDRVVRTLGWAWATYTVVHRDLKPENILFDENHTPYVSDWGLAKTLLGVESRNAVPTQTPSSPKDLRLTAAGSFLGTILYTAPEQILDAASADNRADIYSIGCILYEWEVGHPPFLGRTAEEIAYAHLKQAPPKVAGWLSRTTFGVGAVIMKCLEKTPEARFQSYGELLEGLRTASLRRGVIWTSIPIDQRPPMPRVGWDQFEDFLRDEHAQLQRSDKGVFLAEADKLWPFVNEAETLMGLGEWEKAERILRSLYIPENAKMHPEIAIHQTFAVNYGMCLTRLGRAQEAVEIFKDILPAPHKTAEFYVNFTLALNAANNWSEAERLALEGLQSFPEDRDLMGNYIISLGGQRKFGEAIQVCKRRLSVARDVHILEETALMLSRVGDEMKHTNWPHAFEYYKSAEGLLEEARGLNPRFLSARYSLAKAWMNLGRADRAFEELGDIAQKISLSPVWCELFVALTAECYNESAHFDECVRYLEGDASGELQPWLKIYPSSVRLQRAWANSLAEEILGNNSLEANGKSAKACVEWFEQILQKPVDRAATDSCYLARFKQKLGETTLALDLLDKARTRFASYWKIPYWEASVLVATGNFEPAYSAATEAATKGSWHAETWLLLASICRDSGRADESHKAQEYAEYVKAERQRLASLLSE